MGIQSDSVHRSPSQPWEGRAVLHVDMDAFFASVEQLDHPEWRGKPVIVGGSPDTRGVVATASYEARCYGVHSAMPSAQAKRLCPDAIWTRGHFERYRELSRMVHEIFLSVTPFVEQVSIDEAFLDVTPSSFRPENPVDIARMIRSRIDEIGLSCSIGVATSKTTAKIASDHNKPHGITVVPPGAEARFLGPMPLTVLPGIGAASARELGRAGVTTLAELARLDMTTARALLGSMGPDFVRRAAGNDERPMVAIHDTKSISQEHTFEQDLYERRQIEHSMRCLVIRVAGRLRARSFQARTATIKLRYADFTTQTASKTLPAPTDLDADFLEVALALLNQAWTPGNGLRLIGFGVSGLSTTEQLSLFEAESSGKKRRRALVQGMDAIKERFGEDAIFFGDADAHHDNQSSDSS